jgi:hypothetical protein
LAFTIHPFTLRQLTFWIAPRSLASFLGHLGGDRCQRRLGSFTRWNTNNVLARFEWCTVRTSDSWLASNGRKGFPSGSSGFLEQVHLLNSLFLFITIVAGNARLEGSEFVLDFALCVVECKGAFAAGSDFLLVVPLFVAFVLVRLAVRDGGWESACAVGCTFAGWAIEPSYGGGGGGPDHVTSTLVVPEGEGENKEE